MTNCMRARAALARAVPLLVGASCVCWAGAANAQKVPIGGRTATMGGAGTAAGNDSAMPYLNPAGLGAVPGDIFAVSATAYAYSWKSYTRFFFPDGLQSGLGPWVTDEEHVESRTVFELPTSVMYFGLLNDPEAEVVHRLGMALVIPEASESEIIGTFEGRLLNANGTMTSVQTVNSKWTDYYLGPSYAMSVGGSFRLGLSAFAYYVRGATSLTDSFRTELFGGAAPFSTHTEGSSKRQSLGVVPVLGAQLELTPNLWAGVAVAAPSFHWWGDATSASEGELAYFDPNTGQPAGSHAGSTMRGDFRADSRFRANAGLAWDDRGSFSVAGDIQYYAPRRNAIEQRAIASTVQSATGDVTRKYDEASVIQEDLEQAIDFALGLEVGLSRVVALRVGGFTDLPARSPISSELRDALATRLDRYGGTFGLGLQLGSVDTTLGLVFVHGTGKFGALDTASDQATRHGSRVVPQPMTENTLFFVLSGAVTTEEAQKQIERATSMPPGTLQSVPAMPASAAPAPSPPPRPRDRIDLRGNPTPGQPPPAAAPPPLPPPPPPVELPSEPPAEPPAPAVPNP